ncbi:MAG: hypothetical protein WA916_08740 [Arcobacter sp.]|uniref:hypothetical protein n=1 Tax=Arcobacter sp. TaxID=1872629 RepID=UPI003C709C59
MNSGLNVKQRLTMELQESIDIDFQRYKSSVVTKDKLLQEQLFYYINWRRRFFKEIPRKVFISKELKFNPHYKNRAYKKGIDKIINKFEKGENLTPFLSKQTVFNPYKENSTSKDTDKDNFLNSFNIHHVHIDSRYEDNLTSNVRFVKRNNELLFLMIYKENVYLIDIDEHNFGNTDLIKIIANNWPFIIEPFEMKGILGLSNESLASENVSKLIQHGINTSVKINNKYYAFSQITTSGHNRTTHHIVREFIKGFDEICVQVSIQNVPCKLVIKEGLLYLVDPHSNNTLMVTDNGQGIQPFSSIYCDKKHSSYNFNS